MIYEVDLLEGNILWQTSLNTSETEEFWSTPTFSEGGYVYLLTGGAEVIAIDTITKTTKWTINLHERE